MLIQDRSSRFLRRAASRLWWMILLCSACSVAAALSLASPLDAAPTKADGPRVTITVCAGPDCRVDGSSSCIKAFQQRAAVVANNNKNNNKQSSSIIRVTGRPCVGPCGDGPCVMILDERRNQAKVVVAQPSKKSISLAPPDLFASNPSGWYQVRTPEQVQEVLEIACQAAEIDAPPPSVLDEELPTPYHIASTRPWYDRPRNERKFLQRLMQVTILLGLAQYDDNNTNHPAGESIGAVQYGITGALLLLSTLIMKENVWNTLIFAKRRKSQK